jgi:hypothetical protein
MGVGQNSAPWGLFGADLMSGQVDPTSVLCGGEVDRSHRCSESTDRRRVGQVFDNIADVASHTAGKQGQGKDSRHDGDRPQGL